MDQLTHAIASYSWEIGHYYDIVVKIMDQLTHAIATYSREIGYLLWYCGKDNEHDIAT